MDIETALKRTRAKIVRQRRTLNEALEDRDELVRRAVREGLRPTKVAKLSGLTISRVSQIRGETDG